MDDIPPAMKQCTGPCQQLLPATLAFFYSSKGSKSSKDGLYSRCKTCVSAARRKRPKVPDGYKYCPGCQMNHPATLDYFGACQTRHDKLDVYCKPCAHTRRLAMYAHAKERGPLAQPPEMLVCSACGIPKPATLKFFSMNPQSRYGLNTTCKVCTNAAIQRRGRNREYGRWYEATHKEQTAARLKRWFQAGGNETVKANTRNRRARLRQAEGKHTAQDVRIQYARQKGKCYWCEKKLGTGKRAYHVDHVVPITRGGRNDPSNLVIACHSCNESRNNRLPHEWPEGGRLL